jgi:hypothetical protein
MVASSKSLESNRETTARCHRNVESITLLRHAGFDDDRVRISLPTGVVSVAI